MPSSRPGTTLLTMATAAVLLAACGGQAAAPPPTLPPTAAAAPSPTADSEDFPEVPRISVEDAKAAYFGHTAVFVDVRSTEEYEYRHIPESINLYHAYIEQHLSELDKEKWIITYCG